MFYMVTSNNISPLIDKQQIVVLFILVGLKMQIFKEKIPLEEFKSNKDEGRCFFSQEFIKLAKATTL